MEKIGKNLDILLSLSLKISQWLRGPVSLLFFSYSRLRRLISPIANFISVQES